MKQKAQRRAVQRENKAAHSVQGCAVFPEAAHRGVFASRGLRCSFDADALTSCETGNCYTSPLLLYLQSVAAIKIWCMLERKVLFNEWKAAHALDHSWWTLRSRDVQYSTGPIICILWWSGNRCLEVHRGGARKRKYLFEQTSTFTAILGFTSAACCM